MPEVDRHAEWRDRVQRSRHVEDLTGVVHRSVYPFRSDDMHDEEVTTCRRRLRGTQWTFTTEVVNCLECIDAE